jgi:RNA polymerase sigma-70 factor, ECF subfamily
LWLQSIDRMDDNVTNDSGMAFGTNFDWLYKKYYIPLCTYAFRITKSKDIAEEIVQDTFLKIWENKEFLGSVNSLPAYLYRAVRNNCLNHLKHLIIVHKYEDSYSQMLADAEDYMEVTQENGQSILISKEFEVQVYDAIEKLPEQCRQIFKLSRFEGLKNNEIAEKKGVTINTVQKQISIALEKLREILPPIFPVLLLIASYLKQFLKNY